MRARVFYHQGACPSHVHLLRPLRIGSLPRSFLLHGYGHAREMIVSICSIGSGLVTMAMARTGSSFVTKDRCGGRGQPLCRPRIWLRAALTSKWLIQIGSGLS